MKKKHTHWDYRVEYRKGTRDMLEELIRDFGPEGWELCGVIGSTEGSEMSNWPGVVRYYFKRPRL